MSETGDWSSHTDEELEDAYARLCTLERGHTIYGINADKYESRGGDLSADLDAIEAEMKRRKH